MTMTSPTNQTMKTLEGGLQIVPGLQFAAVASGVKEPGSLDLGVIVADGLRNIAGVFTKNQAAAAPVQICREKLMNGHQCQSIVVNSGNANALTGDAGMDHGITVVERAEALFGGPAFPLSTGVIGVPLPIQKVLDGLQGCKEKLSRNAKPFSQAILTTDSKTKESGRWVPLDDHGHGFFVGGVAKGSGMIHPNMATMLAVLATDAPLPAIVLERMLKRVTNKTFNRISVDGDTSTNDSVLALADIPKDGEQLSLPQLAIIEAAFQRVAGDLAEQIIEDGEGATRILELRVHGARWLSDAKAVAQSISRSPLVKTALHGADLNWGRFISAACNAKVPINLNSLVLKVGGVSVFSGGSPRPDDARAQAAFEGDRVFVELDLGSGGEEVTVLTTDLSKDYVAINAHYRS